MASPSSTTREPARLPRCFALDARSLALGRVALATLLLLDLLGRATDLEAHYTDRGVLPLEALHLQNWDFLWSLHALHGGLWFEALLFAAAGLFAVALLVGYRTFLANLGSWLLLVSLHGRNPLLRDGQDDLLRVLLFWCLFLPLGARASVDRRRGRPSHPLEERSLDAGGAVLTAGSVGLILQLCIVYWAAGLAKLESPWWTRGEGVFYSLSIGRYETAVGQLLLRLPALLKPMAFAVTALELLFPFLLFARQGRARGWVVAAFMLLHAGFALGLRLGLFPWVGMAAWLLLLPPGFWRAVERRLPQAAPRPGGAGGRPPWPFAAASGLALLLVVLYNLQYLAHLERMPRTIAVLCDAVGLNQYWALFSPSPVTSFVMSDGWFVIPAVLEDARQVDLHTDGGPVRWERPPFISRTFKNTRWRHYLANLLPTWPAHSPQQDTVLQSRMGYARWLCQQWNERHPRGQRVVGLSLYYLKYPLGVRDAPATKVLLLQHACLL